jgi:hypothetical protein
MASFHNIRDHLPTLYRPEDRDTSLLAIFLRTIGQLLDEVSRDAGEVMQAHWFTYADRAEFDRYYNRNRQMQALQPVNLPVEVDSALLWEFPLVHDLARLGALLSLPPRREPVLLKDRVEQYRKKLVEFVELYRNGLGTVEALRRIVALELPDESEAEAGQMPFTVEEFVPVFTSRSQIEARGEPTDMVGPLMRWSMVNDGFCAVLPTVYIQGTQPVTGEVDPTRNPIIELFQIDGTPERLGLAYEAQIPAGQTLRLQSAYSSWIGTESGVQRAGSRPAESRPADPTAPGPWADEAGAPAATITALYQSPDRVLWVAAENDGQSQLWRFDGQDWVQVLANSELSVIHCLADKDQALLIGTQAGLLKMQLYPDEGESWAATPIAALDGQPVHAIFRTAGSQYWIGTGSGAGRLNADDTVSFSVLQDTAVKAIAEDGSGVMYFGGAHGLFQYQPAMEHWYWYGGKEESDQIPDWQPFLPGELPADDDVFLPEVTAVHVGPDASIWIGTTSGLARYIARTEKGLAYRTLLEAFPDLVADKVYKITEDARGRIWFCTGRGIFVYNGRDMLQFDSDMDQWISLGRPGLLYPGDREPIPRDPWRFARNAGWQRFNYSINVRDWQNFDKDPRSRAQDTVLTILWTDSVAAHLGAWDGESFSVEADADVANLRMRLKPASERIVDGGLPAVPRLPAGQSSWRYLALEPPNLPEPAEKPSWTSEGRLWQPPSPSAPYPGRYREREPPPPEGRFDETVFAFLPAARLWFEWQEYRPFAVLVRLQKQTPDAAVHPAVVDRVWEGIQLVRPAGVKALLAIDEQIVRGMNNG